MLPLCLFATARRVQRSRMRLRSPGTAPRQNAITSSLAFSTTTTTARYHFFPRSGLHVTVRQLHAEGADITL